MKLFEYNKVKTPEREESPDYWIKFYSRFWTKGQQLKNLKSFKAQRNRLNFVSAKSFEARVKALEILTK